MTFLRFIIELFTNKMAYTKEEGNVNKKDISLIKVENNTYNM